MSSTSSLINNFVPAVSGEDFAKDYRLMSFIKPLLLRARMPRLQCHDPGHTDKRSSLNTFMIEMPRWCRLTNYRTWWDETIVWSPRKIVDQIHGRPPATSVVCNVAVPYDRRMYRYVGTYDNSSVVRSFRIDPRCSISPIVSKLFVCNTRTGQLIDYKDGYCMPFVVRLFRYGE